MSDRSVAEVQLGRPARSSIDVVVRCHLGLPVVIAVPPLLDDGTPFPTRYWLTCPLAVRRIGRAEAAGGVKAAESRIDSDPPFAAAHMAATNRYEQTRDELLPVNHDGPAPRGGVGGARVGVKCLHAHYADHAAGNENPVGRETATVVEPLDCPAPCVVAAGEASVRNIEWSEPKR
jgi:hypothetical protein